MDLQAMLKELDAKYVTTGEAAKILSKAVGKKLKADAARRLAKSKKVESLDVAGKLYLNRASLSKLIASGWKPGERVGGDREFVCYNVWLKKADLDAEKAAIDKVLSDRDVRMAPRKYYHKKKEANAAPKAKAAK